MKQLTVKSYSKGVTQSPRKVAIVASLVRGRSVEDAIVILDHTPRRAASVVKKAIESARANALHNHNVDANGMMLESISVTTGKRLKRFVPASRGRALPFEKKQSNILVEVSGVEKAKIVKKADTKTTVKTSSEKESK